MSKQKIMTIAKLIDLLKQFDSTLEVGTNEGHKLNLNKVYETEDGLLNKKGLKDYIIWLEETIEKGEKKLRSGCKHCKNEIAKDLKHRKKELEDLKNPKEIVILDW